VAEVGAGQLARGVDISIEGMCVGDELELTVPAVLGFGAQGRPCISERLPAVPGNTELHYVVRV
jgi:FKBP-type peptidyl-prolyl cis-trans isomerase